MGPDSSERDVDVIREYPWSLAAPFKLHFMEFFIVFADTSIRGDGLFCGSVNHGVLCFPGFY